MPGWSSVLYIMQDLLYSESWSIHCVMKRVRLIIMNLYVSVILYQPIEHCGLMCLSQFKPSELYIPSFEKSLGLRPQPFSKLRM